MRQKFEEGRDRLPIGQTADCTMERVLRVRKSYGN